MTSDVQEALPLTVYAAHCFTCPHVERAFTPEALHEQMEKHYRRKHRGLIAMLVAEGL